MTNIVTQTALLTGACALSFVAAGASAQTTLGTATPSGASESSGARASDGAQLEEIIVTARKRAENLQDVSVSVDAVSGQALQNLGAARFEDVRLPAVRIGQGGFTDSLFIRGVGSGNNQGFEQSAPIFIDGAWFGSSRTARMGFLDLERIEVLKGPQPTYFGKNAIGGAISVVTRKPTKEFEAGIDSTYEFNQQELSTTAYVSIPLTDNFGIRAAGRFRNLDKGWLFNTATGTNDPRQEDRVGRISARWEATENLVFNAKYEQGKVRQFGRETQLFACNPTSTIINRTLEDCELNRTRAVRFDPAAFGVALQLWRPNLPYPEYSEVTLKAAQMTIDWELGGGYSIRSLMSFYDQNAYQATLPAHQVNTRTAAQLRDDAQNFSQELRIESPRDKAFSWTLGFYHDKGNLVSLPTVGLPIVLAGRINTAGIDQDDETWSVFGEGAFKLSDPLALKLGGRWSQTRKIGLGQRRTYQVNPFPPTGVPTTITLLTTPAQGTFDVNFDRTDSSFDPAVTLEFKPERGKLFYLSWRQGFKAGGLDHNLGSFGATVTNLAAANQFKPEEVRYYEAGVKLSLLDRRMNLNISAFRGDYKNLQVAVYDAELALFRTVNAAKSRSQGVEADLAFALTPELTLNASVNYLDSKYLDFKGAACYLNPPQTAAQGCLPVAGAPAGTNAQDRSGQPTQFAPEWSGNASIQYQAPVGLRLFGSDVKFSGQVDWLWTSSYFTDNFGDPDTLVNAFSKFDARVALAADDNAWEFALIGRNLTEKLVPVWVGNQVAGGNNSSHFAITDRPRQLALQLKVRFR
jgi:outer membrane receptor protein involved in Fe transport